MYRTSPMQRTLAPPVATSRRTGGAVIVVVLALMAMLAFLGLFFYDFVQVEANTAENFSQTVDPLAGVDPESIINNGLSQIIVHPDERAIDQGSVLDGGKASLLAHVLGTIKGQPPVAPATAPAPPYKPHDFEFRNGRGIRLVPGTPPRFVYTGNDASPNPPLATPGLGTDEPDLVLNRSAAANLATAMPFNGTRLADDVFNFEPDVGYTYPDLNSIFLSMEYLQAEDTNGNGMQDGGETDLNGNGSWNANDFVRVIKPSFMDPAVFLALQGNTTQWYLNNATKRWTFRPHLSHLIPGTTTPRFIDTEFPKIDSTAMPLPTLALGPWTTSGKDYSGLDVDADADGIRDSIYMDLGLDPVTLQDGSGRTLIPMSFWKIEDLNGSIDLNSAGNIADLIYKNRTGTVNLVSDVYNLYYPSTTTVRPVHYSHYGLSRAEVNPMWALWAPPPGSADGRTRWDVGFYRNTSNATFTRIQLQNTELAMLLMGTSASMEQSISDTHDFDGNLDDLQGRYGDPAGILTDPVSNPAAMPDPLRYSGAGQVTIDDDPSEDANNNGMLDDTEDDPTYPNKALDGYMVPRGIHPTDSFGTGGIPIDTGNRGARQLTLSPLATGKVPFASYVGRWQGQPASVLGSGYSSIAGGSLLEAMLDLRADDPAEVNRYSYMNAERDNLFRPSETAALLLSDYDYTRSAMFSRVRQLAPFNFNMSGYSRDIRRQFTTESWNRREFSFPFDPNRPFEHSDSEAGEDTNGNGILDTGEDTDGDGQLDRIARFPPAFGGLRSRHETGTVANLDPFRPEVRRLLTTRSVQGDLAAWQTSGILLRNRINFPQLPLELNRILDDQPSATAALDFPAFDALGNPNFRPLTPHPNLRTASGMGAIEQAMVHGNSQTAFPPAPHPVRNFPGRLTDPFIQEWWARYDRQRAARDIYVLLATLCPPLNVNPTTTGLDPDLAKEMAQFAVNYVDAFDEDDVITKFEYDIDLSNGWDATGTLPFVRGVEAQKLTFGEVLWIKQDANGASGSATNVTETYHDESDGHHQWLYIELRNCTPFNVDLEKNTWRIVRLDPDQVAADPDLDVSENGHMASMTFESTAASTGGAKVVAPGANFVVSSHDGNLDDGGVYLASDYYADIDTTIPGQVEAVVPAGAPAFAPVAGTVQPPQCDLDLCHLDHEDHFEMVPITPTASNLNPKMLYFDEGTADMDDRLILSLQRRPHLWTGENVTNWQDTDWVEVDRFNIDDVGSFEGSNQFSLTDGSELATKIPEIMSNERFHHLDNRGAKATELAMGSRPTLANHSIKRPGNTDLNTVTEVPNVGARDMTGVYSSVWQPHHDRELTSAYELLTIPVVGPHKLIASLRDHVPDVDVPGGISGWANSTTPVAYAASARFIPRRPPDPSIIPWTRLLNFVTLPDPTDRVQRKLNPNFVRGRTFGQININTVRTPPVLEGLIDDPRIIQPNSPALTDVMDTTNRLWWNDFQARRDGAAGGGMSGLGSAPFLPPGQFNFDPANPGDAVERGLARHRVIPTGPTNRQLGVFEARSLADVDGTPDDVVDVHTRNRLLQKLANNTSTRSHMFAIWGGVDFFEGESVTVPTGTAFQVGVKAGDVKTCRWFFIVDMTRLEEASVADGTFDWRKFVVYRQRLE